jgi:cell division protein FtsA
VVSLPVLAAITEPRVEEILVLAREEIARLAGAEVLAAGIVITGGTARLHGIAELAETVFEMPARIGLPQGTRGVADLAADPRYATSLGLVHYGAIQQLRVTGAAGWPRSARWRDWIRERVPFLS